MAGVLLAGVVGTLIGGRAAHPVYWWSVRLMLQVGVHIFAYVVIPVLGAVLWFVVNPRKTPLRGRLLVLLFCSVWLAPFLLAELVWGREGRIDWRVELPRTFLAGPFFLLWLAGIKAIDLFLRAAYRR